jgi:polygalacturonase
MVALAAAALIATLATTMAAAAAATAPPPRTSLPRGVLSVTDPPWRADPTGSRDATAALQAAIEEGANTRMTVFIPAGRYRVTDTLNCSASYTEE